MRGKGINITLTENAKPRAYSANQAGMGVAPYVLNLPGSQYDIGLYDDGNGGYEARTDFWGNHVEKILGVQACSVENRDQARMGKLFQTYGICAAEETARMQGYQTRRVMGQEGAVELIVTGVN